MKKKRKLNSALAAIFVRPTFDKVVYLFTEGQTELRYLQDLTRGKRVQIVPVDEESTPWLLMSKVRDWAWKNRTLFARGAKNSIWVIFDDDEKTAAIERTINELNNPPKGFNRGGSMPAIAIGYMKPCIELWGAMCVQGDAKGLPATHTPMETKLKKVMKGYDHDSHRYFDLKQMTKTRDAVKLAMSWRTTYGDFPECVGAAARFAGIAPLVEMIVK